MDGHGPLKMTDEQEQAMRPRDARARGTMVMADWPKGQCLYCVYWTPPQVEPPGMWRWCLAYPKGIPDGIYEGRDLHTEPVNGIMYRQWHDAVLEPELAKRLGQAPMDGTIPKKETVVHTMQDDGRPVPTVGTEPEEMDKGLLEIHLYEHGASRKWLQQIMAEWPLDKRGEAVGLCTDAIALKGRTYIAEINGHVAGVLVTSDGQEGYRLIGGLYCRQDAANPIMMQLALAESIGLETGLEAFPSGEAIAFLEDQGFEQDRDNPERFFIQSGDVNKRLAESIKA